jgi:thymidylate synthase ThyX
MFKPSAKIIADSINEDGDRLTTFVLTYHRFIHSEMMTHRMLSKNSSSSRAIPVEKMIAKVGADDVYPLHWGANQKGMSADNEVPPEKIAIAELVWDAARIDAINYARKLVKLGIHKQVVNRLLEPFSSITVICSGTEYQNFFNQRCHPDAQPEIKAIADLMRHEYGNSHPTQLDNGQWHIPFCDMGDRGDWYRQYLHSHKTDEQISEQIKIAVGRCARVSYLNHDGTRNIEKDIELHDRLLTSKPAHLSPFEHIAVAKRGKFANFTGFQSYRNQIEN